MIRPSKLEIFVMDADGSNKRQLTDNGAANFAPYFFPSGDRVILSPTCTTPEDVTSICTPSTSMAPDSSASLSTRNSMAFRCSTPMEQALLGLEPLQRETGGHKHLHCGLG